MPIQLGDQHILHYIQTYFSYLFQLSETTFAIQLDGMERSLCVLLDYLGTSCLKYQVLLFLELFSGETILVVSLSPVRLQIDFLRMKVIMFPRILV